MTNNTFGQKILRLFVACQSILIMSGLIMTSACNTETRSAPPPPPPQPTSSLDIIGVECSAISEGGILTVTVLNNTNQTLYPSITNFVAGFAAFIYYINQGNESGLSTFAGGCAESPLYGSGYTGTISFTSLPPGLSVLTLTPQGVTSEGETVNCQQGTLTLCAISGTDGNSVLYSSPIITVIPTAT